MNKLFVIGLQKTGTSSLVGLLNSHPSIFVMYEVALKNSLISKYGKEIIYHIPETRRCFNEFENEENLYLNFFDILEKLNYKDKIKYFGDKLLRNEFIIGNKMSSCFTIFMVRDIKTWLCKPQIIQQYMTNVDILTPSITYLKYLIESFKVERSLRLKMEDLVIDQDKVIKKISNFLELDSDSFDKKWWYRLGKYEENSIKSKITWYSKHLSSHTKPSELDTTAKISDHKFWKDYLLIFNKYYENLEMKFDNDEIEDDLYKLIALKEKYHLIPLNDAFSEYQFKEKQYPFKRRLKSSIIYKFSKLVNLF